jgi:hypothetical protein
MFASQLMLMLDLFGLVAAVSLRPVPFAMTVRVATGRAEDTLPEKTPRLSQPEPVLGRAEHWISSTFPLFSRTSTSALTVATDLVLTSVILSDLLDAHSRQSDS